MFECQYCETKFLTEEKFQKHTCRQRDRMIELDSFPGTAAFTYYVLWFKKRNLREPSKDTFVVSKYYSAFFKFVKFVREMGIPDVNLYIKLMSQESIQPSHWYNDDIYNFFINYLDNECSPNTHIKITLLTLDKLANHFDCEINEVFDHLRASDTINLVQTRNLSPWVLLLSKKFKQYLQKEVNAEESKLIENAIHINKWKLIMESKRNFIPKTREYLTQLDI